MKNNQLSVREICMIGLWAAVIAVMAQITIPMPLGVPMTMQTFAITLAAVVMGKKGGMATLIYILLGAIGLPVYAGFSGGISCILGPTGGFIVSFPIMAYIIGIGAEMRKDSNAKFILFLILGTLTNYVIGILFFCPITGSSIWTGLTACVFPFIPTAIIKAVLAVIVGIQIKSRLVRTA